MDNDRNVITDRMWALMEPECLDKPTDPGRTGGDGRLFMEMFSPGASHTFVTTLEFLTMFDLQNLWDLPELDFSAQYSSVTS